MQTVTSNFGLLSICLFVSAAVLCTHWAHGGEGAKALAEAVIQACAGQSKFQFLYPLEASIKDKIEAIAKNVSYCNTNGFLGKR